MKRSAPALAARLRDHAAPLVIALLLQGGIQFLLAVGGILIVRELDTAQYADYALTYATISAGTAISNSGVVDGLTALAGRSIGDSVHLGRIVATALRLRQRIAGIAALVLLPALAALLWRGDATPLEIAGLLGMAAAANWIELHYAITIIVPWLRNDGRRIQAAELGGAAVRCLAVVLLAGLLPDATVAIGCGAVGIAVQLFLLHRWRLAIRPAPETDPALQREIMRIVRRQWPNEVSSLIQVQGAIWLLGIFAGSRDVAVYAALGRVNVLFAIVLAALHRTAGARYAVTQDRRLVGRRYLQVMLVHACLASALLVSVIVFPGQVLALLGARYAGETALLRLSALVGMIGSFSVLAQWLNAMRGWIIPPAFGVPFQVASLGLLLAAFGAASVHAVLLILLGAALLQILANLAYFRHRLMRMPPRVPATDAAS